MAAIAAGLLPLLKTADLALAGASGEGGLASRGGDSGVGIGGAGEEPLAFHGAGREPCGVGDFSVGGMEGERRGICGMAAGIEDDDGVGRGAADGLVEERGCGDRLGGAVE